MSLGTLSNSEKIVSAAAEEAKIYIQQQTTPVHADETSHKLQGDKMWIWLAATMFVAVFIIRAKRDAKAPKDLLGKKFTGILITDRFASYNWINAVFRQFCWAHLKRDMQKISERSGKPGKIGDEILDYIRRMFRLWHRHKDEEISRKAFRIAMMTTTTTCKLQDRNRYNCITEAIIANLKGEPIPSLLPAEENPDSLDLTA